MRQNQSSLVAAHKVLGSTFPDYRKMARGWSNISDDGLVVLSCWAHQFHLNNDLGIYYTNVPIIPESADWHALPQNKKRIAHLKYAVEKCNRLVKVVVVTARDLSNLKGTKTYTARPDMLMYITQFDDVTGEFTAVVVKQEMDVPLDWLHNPLDKAAAKAA